MNRSDLLRSLKSLFTVTLPRVLFLYLLAPCLLLVLFRQPIVDAALRSESAAFRVLLIVLGAVALNEVVYRIIRRKHPSFLVFAYGAFCLLAVVTVQYLALPGHNPLVSTLAIIGITLLQVVLILLSFWFVSLKTKPAYAAAVTIRVIVGIFLVIMAFQVVQEIESGLVNGYTWLTLGILVLLLLGLFGSKVRSAFRRGAFRRRAAGLAEGEIVRIVGETHLDVDDDLVTVFHAYIRYTVDDASYETRTDIARSALRMYGKENFIGQAVPVHYDPANPASAYTDRIRKPVKPDDSDEGGAEGAPEQKNCL